VQEKNQKAYGLVLEGAGKLVLKKPIKATAHLINPLTRICAKKFNYYFLTLMPA
jgi:hypothetical protein